MSAEIPSGPPCKICGAKTYLLASIDIKSGPRFEMPPLPPGHCWGKLRPGTANWYWDYFQCAGPCGCLMTFDMDGFSDEQMAAFYQYNPVLPWKFRTDRERRVLAWIEKTLGQKGKDLLLFGPGHGPSVATFRKTHKIVTCDFGPGFDFPPGGLDADKRTYDLILATEVAEHLRAPRQEISSLLKKLRPGGCLAISTGLWNRIPQRSWAKGDWWYINHASEGHIFFWTASAFDLLANEHGCTLISHPLLATLHGPLSPGKATMVLRKEPA